MNEQTIEMQIHAKAQEAIQSINKLTGQLTGIEKKIDSVSNSVNKVSTNNATNEMNKLNSSIDKASKSMTKLKGLFTFTGVKRLTNTILDGLKSSMDYSEALNLFNVVFKNIEKEGKTTFSNLGKEAIEFQNKLNEAFGTNKEQTLTYQALYQSMAENMGIATDKAGIMSENTTKLINDLSSLYNKSEKSVSTALSSGIYAGQVRPLRTYGIDITEKSLQPVLDSLGIERTVRELSQAEKQILRYIAVVRQSSVAHADWAQTIESPSNQLKILSNQVKEAKAYLSSLFIGTFANILPYANAFLMVIKEISKAIANMFGIKIQDYNTGIASSEDAFVDLGSSVDDATGKVKELKRQVLGFDEIHNINENQDSGSGSVGGVSGGIDQRLLDAIKGYDNGMDKVRMKASQIRDDIMKWLGFTKEEVSFKYQGIKTTLKNMWDSFKGLSTQGKILVGLGLVTGALKLWNAGKKLLTVIGSTGLVKQLKNLISYIRIYTKLSGNFIDGIVGGTNAFLKQKIVVTDAWGNINKFKTAINGSVVALTGLVASASGLGFISDSVKNIANGTSDLLTVIGLVGGTVLTIGGTLTTVSAIATAFGVTMSTSMAVATGGISLVVSAIVGLTTYLTVSKDKTSELVKELESMKEQAQDVANSNLVQIEQTQKLSEELQNLIDSNGKVKEGYEDRVKFILNQLNSAFGTEYELVNGAIYNNGRLVNSYNDIKNSIESVIASKKAEIILNAYEEEYVKALENRKIKQDELNKKIEEENKELQDLEEKYKSGNLSQEEFMKRRESTHKAYEKQYQSMKKEIQVFQKDIDNYDKLLYASSTGNLKEIENALSKYITTSKSVTSNYWKMLTLDSEKAKNNINKNLNSLNGRNISGTFNLKANTDGATKSLNEFGNKLNQGGFGNLWTGIRFTPAYANGGMPEDGLFYANHNELVGKFSNGRTAVANNGMIIEGIKAGVYEAVAMAMNQYGGNGGIAEISVHADEGIIVETAINGINQKIRQTGVCPVNIPTY